MTIRQTAIRTYLECALRYRFTYVDQIPYRISGALAFGRAMHRTLERLHREQVRVLPAAHALFDEVWAAVRAEDHPRFDNAAQVDEYADLGDALLRQYLHTPLSQREPVVLEYAFAVPLNGHTITGTVDRIDETPDGLVIVDYKTGKRRPNQAVLDDDLQFTLYHWGVTETVGLPVARCEYFHLRKMETFITHRSPADGQRLQEDILPAVLRGIEAGVFPPSPHYWCNYCDYKDICRAHKGA